jgi:hypothetical protein
MTRARRLTSALLVGLSLAVLTAPARADGGPFGLGLILGSPTGVSGKLYFGKRNALDFAVGAALVNERGFHVHVDYLWHPVMLTEDEAFFLPLYFGIGGRLLSHERHEDSDLHLGVRVPVGIVFDFKRVPIDVFGEVALVVDIIHSSGEDIVDLNAAVGVRYYF